MTSWFRLRGTRDGAHATELDEHGTEHRDRASEPDVTPLQETLVGPAEQFLAAGDRIDDRDDDSAAGERQALLELCLYALDRARSAGVAERIEQGLAGVGVTALRPDGARFDPSCHEAGGTLPTDDPALDGTVAETEVPGFADRGTLLRAPIVTVYTVPS